MHNAVCAVGDRHPARDADCIMKCTLGTAKQGELHVEMHREIHWENHREKYIEELIEKYPEKYY